MTYIFILTPLISVIIAQISKFFIKKNRLEWSWKNLVAYSGMPSSHAAVTISLATIIGLKLGFDSVAFAIALLFAFITIRDAVGIRQYIGSQGKIINKLIKDLNEEDHLDERFPILRERVGHTPRQLIAGAIIGIVVALIINFLA